MLLEHDLSVSPAARAAQIWRHREQIEREAAAQFHQLARELASAGNSELAKRATRAALDEQRHARRCRALVESLVGPDVAPADVPRRLTLGPATLSSRDRMLYAAVALGCVTESLSCALLLELKEAAVHPLVQATVAEIVTDEIEHARIGWAVLAAEAALRDVAWLTQYLPVIAAAAIADDVQPMAGEVELAGLGVLPRERVQALVAETWATVISPGLARVGIRSGGG